MNDHPDLPASGPALGGLDRRGFLKTGLGGALVLAGAGPLSGPKTLEADVVVIGCACSPRTRWAAAPWARTRKHRWSTVSANTTL